MPSPFQCPTSPLFFSMYPRLLGLLLEGAVASWFVLSGSRNITRCWKAVLSFGRHAYLSTFTDQHFTKDEFCIAYIYTYIW